MQVYIEREKRTESLDFSGKARDLLTKLEINPETIVITRNGNLITEDDKVEKGDEIKIISVVSGG